MDIVGHCSRNLPTYVFPKKKKGLIDFCTKMAAKSSLSALGKQSLKAEGETFTLDGNPFRILSGSFHYYRTHPDQWKDRLMRMKAAGLNTG